MKRHSIAVRMGLALGLVATLAVSVKTMPQDTSGQQMVLQLVQTWLDAESQGDSATLDKLLADDFIGTGPGGNILSKGDIVPPAGEERPKMAKSRVKDSTMRLFGNTAVVMGSVAYETLNQPGFRFTLVFMDRGKGWQMIAAHLASTQPAK